MNCTLDVRKEGAVHSGFAGVNCTLDVRKEDAVHSGFAGVNCTLDVRKEDANEGQSNPVAIGDTSIGINHIKKEEPIVKETGHDPFNINIGNDSFEFLI